MVNALAAGGRSPMLVKTGDFTSAPKHARLCLPSMTSLYQSPSIGLRIKSWPSVRDSRGLAGIRIPLKSLRGSLLTTR